MATDSASTAAKLAITRLPAGIYGVLAAGAALWSLAPEAGSRGETLARFVEWTPALLHGFANAMTKQNRAPGWRGRGLDKDCVKMMGNFSA